MELFQIFTLNMLFLGTQLIISNEIIDIFTQECKFLTYLKFVLHLEYIVQGKKQHSIHI